MKLKDLEDFEFFRCHPAGRVLVKSGVVHEKKGHKCFAVSGTKYLTLISKTGNRTVLPTNGDFVYYPGNQTVFPTGL